MNSENDTICAIATGTGSAGIGIVRLSGPESVAIADGLFRGKRRIRDLKSYTAAYGQLVRQTEGKEELLDEVVVLVMRAPHTYTTEDVVELSCHGGPLVLKRVLSAVMQAGARMAEPGEFTKRAFLGGRIDLSEAEAVMDVIASGNERALDASLQQLRGGLSKEISGLREKILYETAYIESALDDPENYSLENYPEHLRPLLSDWNDRIGKFLSSVNEGRLMREGIRTAIVGRPNAGKSSILNLLLGEERAIVTEIEGTTRDTLEESAVIGGVQLVLVDTAGIRETGDVVEQIGVKRAREAADTADLILLVVDAAKALSTEEEQLLYDLAEQDRLGETGGNAPLILLLNKNDLDTVITKEETEKALENAGIRREYRILEISAATGNGKTELAEAVQSLFFSGKLEDSQERYLLNSRHEEALSEARAALGRVRESLDAGVGEDFYTIDLMAAYEALGKIIGETLEDDLADKIFREFCMGK